MKISRSTKNKMAARKVMAEKLRLESVAQPSYHKLPESAPMKTILLQKSAAFAGLWQRVIQSFAEESADALAQMRQHPPDSGEHAFAKELAAHKNRQAGKAAKLVGLALLVEDRHRHPQADLTLTVVLVPIFVHHRQ